MKHKEAKADSVLRIRKRTKAKRSTEEDRVDELEKEVRELKGLNRSLMKQLKKLSKGINRLEFEEALERLDNEQEISEKTKGSKDSGRKCPDCNSKSLNQFELAGRKFERCEVCGYRSGKVN